MKQMLTDPRIPLVPRNIDQDWRYLGVIPDSVVGFNPQRSSVYYARKSYFAEWLEQPRRSTRELNEQDYLVREVLFAVHDYLHAWAYLAIRELTPKLGFGTTPITAANLDDFAFCHLLTEAVATIGLDYWYLSCTDLNSVCDIGTTVRALTTAYLETDLREFRKFNPKLVIQDVSFFESFARFYCTGVLKGFELDDLRQSPKLLRWLGGELTYGETQRTYVRQWLSHLSGIELGGRELDAPIEVDLPWKKKLIRALSEMLWDKVKKNVRHSLSSSIAPDEAWASSEESQVDFRFLNLVRLSGAEIARFGKQEPRSYDWFVFQALSGCELSKFQGEPAEVCDRLLAAKDVNLVLETLGPQSRLSGEDQGPRDLFFLN
ncbi:MAG: hypothetical protein ACXWPM_13175 [Bdellovibrionota bacterium]